MKEQTGDDDSIATGEATICTVDKEDVKDHGSSSEEDNNMPNTELCDRMQNDDIDFNQKVVCNYATAFLPRSDDDNSDDNDSDDD